MSSSKTSNGTEASSSNSNTCSYLPTGSLFTNDRLIQLQAYRQTHNYKQQLTKIYTLRITIDHVNPRIFRVVNVPAKLTLDQVHHVIMYSLGWADYHCAHFLDPFSPDLYWDVLDEYPYHHPVVLHAQKATLADVFCNCNKTLKYEYDFGDSWWHTLELTEEHEFSTELLQSNGAALCTNGARACAVEDCGGPVGYEQLLLTLRGHNREDHRELTDWVKKSAANVADVNFFGGRFNPELFDINKTNEYLSFIHEKSYNYPRGYAPVF